MRGSGSSEGPEEAGRVTVDKNWLGPDPGEAAELAWVALGGVYDPELSLDVVSLGLVYEVRAEPGRLSVVMTLTTPGCPVSESLPEQARSAIVEATGGSFEVDVQTVWDPPWTPAMMNASAASVLGFR